jgi:rubrerythrin
MTLRTQHNLSVGMHGEAFASAKYKRFAAFARVRQNSKFAALLTDAADESRIGHFARELELTGLISDDIANLHDVIRDTLYDTERYHQFAQEAAQDGDGNAAALFKGLAADGRSRVAKFEAALAQSQESTN